MPRCPDCPLSVPPAIPFACPAHQHPRFCLLASPSHPEPDRSAYRGLIRARAVADRLPRGVEERIGRVPPAPPLLQPPAIYAPAPDPPDDSTPPPSGSVLFTGGLGDTFALDSWMHPAYRAGLRRVLWATPGSDRIAALLAACPSWRHVEHRHAWPPDGFSATGRRAWYHPSELAAALPPGTLDGAADLSVATRFPALLAGRGRFHGSSLLADPPPADLGRFNLPERFALVCPGTTSTHRLDRFYDGAEYKWTLDQLERWGLIGVVVGGAEDRPPMGAMRSGRLIDLGGETTVAEAVGLACRCSAYVGIDACWSVLAAQHLDAGMIAIRSGVPHLHVYQSIYYAPHRSFPFVRRAFWPSLLWGGCRDPINGELDRLREFAVVIPSIPQPQAEYGVDYWRKYQTYADSDIGRALNRFRVDWVASHVGAEAAVFDIGIGCGTFLEWWGGPGYGYDVNPSGVKWLEETGRWCDPYFDEWPAVAAVVMNDSFEHIRDPQPLLERIPSGVYLFVSIPVFEDLSPQAIRASKHYRPDEHRFYVSSRGLIDYLRALGFAHLETRRDETELGRESIASLAFLRR